MAREVGRTVHIVIPPGLVRGPDENGSMVFAGRARPVTRDGEPPARVAAPADRPMEIVWADGVQLVLMPDDLPAAETRGLGAETGDRVIPGADGSRGGPMEPIVRMTLGLLAPVALGALAEAWDRRQARGGVLHAVDAEGRLMPVSDRVTVNWEESGAMLVLLHGTFVTTSSSFQSLFESSIWRSVHATFDGRVLAFDHPTLTKDPLENATALLEALGKPYVAGKHIGGRDLYIVSHSRGGLVADVLAAACAAKEGQPDLRRSRFEGEDQVWFTAMVQGFEALARRCRAEGYEVRQLVRVAAPVRGTSLAGWRLDLWLNAILHAVSLVPALATGVFEGLRELLVALVQARGNPEATPGLAAMMSEKPFVPWLNAMTAQGELICITGDAADRSSFFRRLRTFFAEKFFQGANDLVVDTPMMEGGAQRAPGSTTLRAFRNGPGATIDHFSYFSNSLVQAEIARDLLQPSLPATTVTRGASRGEGLSQGAERDLIGLVEDLWEGAGVESVEVAGAQESVILLPGIMGTTLSSPLKEQVWPVLSRLAFGGFVERLASNAKGVEAGLPLAGPYRRLVRYLARARLNVDVCGFDWRLSVKGAAKKLETTVGPRLAGSKGPVHLMAHSMGGLVARAWMAEHPETAARWKQRGGRLLMLGTPNHGSYAIPLILLGQEPLVTMLAAVDLFHDESEVARVAQGFTGLLEMMPADPTRPPEEWPLFDPDVWAQRRIKVEAKALKQALAVRKELLGAVDPKCMVYVAGTADETPCDLPTSEDGPALTDEGDGRVTWWHGRLEGVPMWRLDAGHGDLCDVPRAFPAFLELLRTGQTSHLSPLPRVLEPPRADRSATRGRPAHPARPLVYPDTEMFVRAAVGGQLDAVVPRPRTSLKVDAVVGDFHTQLTPLVLCHAMGTRLSLTELIVDHVMLGELRRRVLLQRYPNLFGEVVAVDTPRPSEVTGRLERVYVVGTGPADRLTRPRRTEALTRAFLEILHDASRARLRGPILPLFIQLAVGNDEDDEHDLEDTVIAALEAILKANQLARRLSRDAAATLQVGEERAPVVPCEGLRFLHPSAAVAERLLDFARDWVNGPGQISSDQVSVTIDALPVVPTGLAANVAEVTLTSMNDTDRQHDLAPAATRRAWEQVRRISVRSTISETKARDGEPPREREPHRLEFDTGGSRASFRRLQQIVSWPKILELAEALTGESRLLPNRISALRDHVVPADFVMEFDAGLDLQIGVDRYSAAVPWEAFVAPALQNAERAERIGSGISILRQFEDRTPPSESLPVANGQALVICCPGGDKVPFLAGAREEAEAVTKLLRERYLVRQAGPDWSDIAAALAEPAEIVHFIGHGVFKAGDTLGTGIVADGRVVSVIDMRGFQRHPPSLVFLNACHLGQSDPGYHELAAGMAADLVCLDVPAVVAAGWAVNDGAAVEFARRFYSFALADRSFLKAVAAARASAFRVAPNHATWAAYQCYGDPNFRLPSVQPQYATLNERLVAEVTRPVTSPAEVEVLLARVLRLNALYVPEIAILGLTRRGVLRYQLEGLVQRIEGAALPVSKELMARARSLVSEDGGAVRLPAAAVTAVVEMVDGDSSVEVVEMETGTSSERLPDTGVVVAGLTTEPATKDLIDLLDAGDVLELQSGLASASGAVTFANRLLLAYFELPVRTSKSQLIPLASTVALRWKLVTREVSTRAVQRWLWLVLRRFRGNPREPKREIDVRAETLLEIFQQQIPDIIDDPNAGTCGGRSRSGDLILDARVEKRGGGRCGVTVTVQPHPPREIEGTVDFILHPTFRREKVTVKFENGCARVDFEAWDSFTVVARVRTPSDSPDLEFDLGFAENADKPEFRRFRLG